MTGHTLNHLPENTPEAMPEHTSGQASRSRPFIRMDNAALQHNFKLLAGLAGTVPPGSDNGSDNPANHGIPESAGHGGARPGILAVIKSEAYGHGMVNSAAALLKAGARDFGVGSVFEAAQLREAMPAYASNGDSIRVISLLGQHGPDEAELCLRYRITPFVGGSEELNTLLARVRAFKEGTAAANNRAADYHWNRGATTAPFPIILKFNTGMSRLGFNPSEAADLADYLKGQNELLPVLLASHLARSDETGDESLDKTRQQARKFLTALNIFKAHWPGIMGSLCNSAGLLRYGEIMRGLDVNAPQMHRPGLALYGIDPFYGTTRQTSGQLLKPVMNVLAPVLAVQDLGPNAEISYGGTFVAPHKMRVAVLAVGYADGLNRGISRFNIPAPSPASPSPASLAGVQAGFCLNGHKVPLLGRICMQMCVVDVSALPPDRAAKPGDMAYILGGKNNARVRAEELAAWADTIPYEIVCAFGRQLKI